jgi:hypothetical protein
MLLNIHSKYERMRCSRIKKHNCRSAINEKHTNHNTQSFLSLLHSNMVDSTRRGRCSCSRNRVGSTGRGRCSCSCLISMSQWIEAPAGIMSLLSTVVAPMISL